MMSGDLSQIHIGAEVNDKSGKSLTVVKVIHLKRLKIAVAQDKVITTMVIRPLDDPT